MSCIALEYRVAAPTNLTAAENRPATARQLARQSEACVPEEELSDLNLKLQSASVLCRQQPQPV